MSGPRISFVIGGVQKAGTSALFRYLSPHPAIALPDTKEAHVFDAPGFDEGWDVEAIDALYAGHFRGAAAQEALLWGDATPIYVFHPRLVARIARYNPAMRWILLLRDPAERALSHYFMERRRDQERWPLWAAMLFERWRLRSHWRDLGSQSPLRLHSYRARGDYARQLDVLYAHFPQDQVLLLRSDALMGDTVATLSRVHAFLGVEDRATAEPHPKVFVGDYTAPERNGFTMRFLRWLMRHERRAMRERYGLEFD